MDRTLVALDLETTGLTPRLDRIIEVGAVRFRGGQTLERFESLVRPQVPIPGSVQMLTGITDADVQEAPSAEVVLRELIDFVGDTPVVAHGGSFDLSFMSDAGGDSAYELFDTLDLARILLPAAPSHSLPHLSRQLGLGHGRPHRALSDAEAARELFGYLWEFARGLPRELLDQMLVITVGWTNPVRSFLAGAEAAGASDGMSLPVRPAPARAPRKEATPSTDPAAIRALLDPDGPMAARLEDYEPREAQQQMTLAIAQLYTRGGRLIAEAGPGTGKSLAYLLPSVHHAVAKKERVVVATNTITLQEQLMDKDIPFLRSWLPFDFDATLLKGRSNYVSLRRWNRYLNAPSLRVDGTWFSEEVKFKLRMLVWLAGSGQGDRAEIRLNGLDEVFWLRAASTAEDCLAAHCDNYKTQRCFYWNSRRAAHEADIVVTNHALLLADALGSGTVLPPYQHLVVDEAHKLEESAIDTLTVRVGEEELLESLESALTWHRAASGSAPAPVRIIADQVRHACGDLFAELKALLAALQPALPEAAVAGGRPPRAARLVLDGPGRRLPEAIRASGRAGELALHANALRQSLDAARGHGEADPNTHASRELELFSDQLRARAGVIEEAFLNPQPERLYWVQAQRRSGRPIVQAAPTDAGRVLYEKALSEKATVVFTSASLAVAGSFDYFKRGVGLPAAGAYELILGSPFDYLSQALLCLPTDLYDLDDPRFLEQTGATVAGVARALGGQTLVLFTAHQQLHEVAARLRALTASDGLRVLAQNIDGTRRQLLQQFQDDSRSVLCGTSSFWEGIDVPGDGLSCVVIVRLPFKVPTDPVQIARSAALADPFAELMLPEAALRLKQGFGRLIRRRTDRGAVVLLDHRVANRAYGRAFLDALPRAAVHLGRCEELAGTIARWLGRTAAA